MSNKDAKIREVLKELAAEYFSRESNRTSLITITDVELRSRGAVAIVKCTVLPVDQEVAALDFMHRQLSDFRAYVGDHARLMRIPYFEVVIDAGEKNRQRLDNITPST